MLLSMYINILACPNCKRKIHYDKEENILCCFNCNNQYFIRNNIPILLMEKYKKEIHSSIKSRNGQQMNMEFHKDGIFYKIFALGKKIINSDYISSGILERKYNILASKEMILNIGSGCKKLDKRAINLDLDFFHNVDIIAEAHNLPFIDESFDVVWIEMVLEHVKNPHIVVSEIHRILKRDGYVVSMVPFIHPYHGYPSDYSRYSLDGMKNLFSKFGIEEISVYRGPSVALINILSDYISLFLFTRSRKINLFIKALALILLFPIKFLDIILVKNSESHKLAHTFCLIGKKLNN